MRACRALGALTLLVLGLVAFTPVTDHLQPPPAPPPRPAQAIVVLGSYMGTDGTLSAASLQRSREMTRGCSRSSDRVSGVADPGAARGG